LKVRPFLWPQNSQKDTEILKTTRAHRALRFGAAGNPHYKRVVFMNTKRITTISASTQVGLRNETQQHGEINRRCPHYSPRAVGGTGRGADTAAVIAADSSNRFFNIKVGEKLAKPVEF